MKRALRATTFGVLISVGVLAGCGEAGRATRLDSPTSPAPKTPAPTLPDLHDPAVRVRFVCSFAPGSFGITPSPQAVTPSRDDLCAS
jgi:hypothetical protein